MTKLREIAHSRTGDKGNTSNISVIAYDAKHYPLLLAQVTSERVRAHFAGVVEGEVVRYELPNIAALNFVMQQALGGGVNDVRTFSAWLDKNLFDGATFEIADGELAPGLGRFTPRRFAPAERARVRGYLAPRDDARHLRLRAGEPAHAARVGPGLAGR